MSSRYGSTDRLGRASHRLPRPGAFRSLGPVLFVVVLAALLLGAFAGLVAASPAAPAFDKYEGLSGQAPASAGLERFTPVPDPRSLAEAGEDAVASVLEMRYEDDSVSLDLSGNWWTVANSSSTAGHYVRGGAYTSATFSFSGTYVGWVATKGPAMGRAMVSVDGGAATTVDLYSSTVAYQRTVWAKAGLAQGDHVVTLWWDLTNVDGTFISIDAFDVHMYGTGSISGKVTNASGTGLSDVTVLAIDSQGEAVGGALTGAAGAYSITDLPNQSVKVVTINDQGYIDEWYNNVVAPGNWDGVGAAALNLASTPTRTSINFSLAVGRTISGRVSYLHGGSLEGLEVDAFDAEGDWYNYAETDEYGNYRITGLPAGRYLIATNSDWYIDEWYDDVLVYLDPSGETATLVDVRTTSATNKDFVLDLGLMLHGKVTDSANNGLNEIEVRVQSVDGAFTDYVWTNSAGYFDFKGIPEGFYVVNTANDQGYIDEWYNNDPAPGDIFGDNAAPIRIGMETWGIDFALDRGYSISGTVTDNTNGEPPADPGMIVNIFDAEGKWYAFDFADAESGGHYSTWALPAGTYYAQASDSLGDTGMFLGSSYIEEWYDDLPCGEYDLAAADPIVIGSANVTGIDFGLDPLNRYEQTDTRIVYDPAWTTFNTGSASGGSYFYSSTVGSSATIYFRGTRLDWIAMMGTTTGLADVYVDEELVADNVDLSADVATYQVKMGSTGCLPFGLHKVVIAYEATNVVGKRITLDAVEIAGTLVDAPAAVTALSPSSGPAAGGTTVTITGTKLTGATAVKFGDAAATNVNVVSPTRITCTSPAHEAGVVDVTVTTPGGTSLISGTGNDFTFTPRPTVGALDPTSGTTSGGTSVTITGTGLTGATAVTFGGAAATSVVVGSDTQLTCITPAHVAGTVNVQVTTAGGASSTAGAGDDYTYEAPVPTVTGLSPTSGRMAGGTIVTLTGTGLTGATAVTFGEAAATNVTVVSHTQITCTSPGHDVGTVDVRVTTAGGTSSADGSGNDFTYTVIVDPIRYEQTDTRIVKTGSWADYAKPGLASGGSYGRSLTSGASATIYFIGTRLDWIAMKGTTTGKVDVYVDGKFKETVDLTATSASYGVPVWTSGDLADGQHNVRIVRSASNTSSRYITLDAVDIWGTIDSAPTRYQQIDTRIVKVGSWTTFAKTAASGLSYGRSSTSGPAVPDSPLAASATIYFTGTRLDWVAMMGTTAGAAKVYVDGVFDAQIVLHASTASYNVTVWSSGVLDPGDHVVRIVRDWEQSAAGQYLTLDAVDIWGTIRTAPPQG